MFSHFLVRDTSCVLGSGLECIDWPSGFRYGDGSAKPARSALGATLLVRSRGPDELALWGRLGGPALRRSGVLEYESGGQWLPVRRENIRNLQGGGADGIFALRLRGTPTERFRIGVTTSQ